MADSKNPFEAAEPNRLTLYFVKRPDLRSEEIPTDLTPESFHKFLCTWNLFLGSLELGEEIAGEEKDPTCKIWPSMIAIRPLVSPEGVDPFDLLEFFCGCQKSRVYPPGWIMDALAHIFEQYITARNRGEHRPLGDYFCESRTNDWQRITKGMMNLACRDVYSLQSWFTRSREAALDIVALALERAQAPENLTGGWKGRSRIKKRGALEDEYDRQRQSIEKEERILRENGRDYPTTEHREALLLRLGEEALIGHEDLLDQLRRIRKDRAPTKSR